MTVEVIRPADRAAWLAARRKDVTASDVAAVAGADPRRSPLQVFAEKTGAVAEQEDSAVMRRGRWLEAAVIEALQDTYPTWTIKRAGVYLRDPEIRIGATPDAVAEIPDRPGVVNVQCKVVARPRFEAEWEDGRPPLKFELQTLCEGMLLDAETNLVAALVVNTYTAELVVHEVPRHAPAERRIRDIVSLFWAGVEQGVRPAPVFSQDADIIEALYPRAEAGCVLDLSGDNMLPVILAERAELKARMKADEARVSAIDTEIKAKLGDAEAADLPGWKLTWKTQTRAEKLVPASEFRVLRVTDKRPNP